MPNQNLRNQKHGIGLLAQLVQSIWFTPRGSGVRIPQGPQTPQEIEEFFCLGQLLVFSYNHEIAQLKSFLGYPLQTSVILTTHFRFKVTT